MKLLILLALAVAAGGAGVAAIFYGAASLQAALERER